MIRDMRKTSMTSDQSGTESRSPEDEMAMLDKFSIVPASTNFADEIFTEIYGKLTVGSGGGGGSGGESLDSRTDASSVGGGSNMEDDSLAAAR